MAYLSNSEYDIRDMLDTIGAKDFEELIKNIPDRIRFKGDLNIPEATSEYGISKLICQLSEKNKTFVSFLGGGAYDHYIPSVVDSLISRSEFLTSYTPYQPEVSQGNLQAMYEFQSMICELTQMDVTNASMYEAGSALAEAVLLAVNHTRNKKVLIPATINPRYIEIIKSYTANMDIELVEIPMSNYVMDMGILDKEFDESVGAVVVQSPNFFGFIENAGAISTKGADKKALMIMVYNPISLGLLKTPGEYGVDIAVAEGQPLGNAQNFGGPYVGLFSVNEKLVRKIPGRISGVTKDVDGKQGFVLTLQTREQHIRRDKATSNICTNSGLLALAAGIYLATLGKEGIRKVAELCMQKAHYLAEQLTAIKGVELVSASAYFNEFTVRLPVNTAEVIGQISKSGVMPGIDLTPFGHPDQLLIAVTEKRTREQLDQLVSLMRQALNQG